MAERTYREWIETLSEVRPHAVVEIDGESVDIIDELNALDENDGIARVICEYTTETDSYQLTSIDDQGYRIRVFASIT